MNARIERFIERAAWWVLLLWLAMLVGVQLEKCNARHEARLLQRIEQQRGGR